MADLFKPSMNVGVDDGTLKSWTGMHQKKSSGFIPHTRNLEQLFECYAVKFVPEIMCIYNVGNPNAVNKTRVNKQYNNMLKIRSKEPYKRINK